MHFQVKGKGTIYIYTEDSLIGGKLINIALGYLDYLAGLLAIFHA